MTDEKTCSNCRHWFMGHRRPQNEGECYALKSAPVTRADYTCELWKRKLTAEEFEKMKRETFG